MRKFILAKILTRVQKLFSKDIPQWNIFDQKNYQYLLQRNDAKHIVLEGSKIKIVEYSSDPREHPYYEYTFEYLDDFLLKYFESECATLNHHLSLAKTMENDNWYTNFQEIVNYSTQYKDVVKNYLLQQLASSKVFIAYCLRFFKIKRTEYIYFFTHLSTIFAFVLMISFWVLIFQNKYSIDFLVMLLFISGPFFLLNGYIRIESLYRAKKAGKKILFDQDRWLGIGGLCCLFGYAIYWYCFK